MKNTNLHLCILLSLILTLTAIASSSAASIESKVRYNEGMYQLELRDVEVSHVLEMLFRGTHLEYRLKRGGDKRITLSEKRLIFDDALQAIVNAAHLDIRMEKGIFIISSTNPPEDSASHQAPSVPEPVTIEADIPESITSLDTGPLIRVGLTTIGKPRKLIISAASEFDIRDMSSDRVLRAPSRQEISFILGSSTIEIQGPYISMTCSGPVRLISTASKGVFDIIEPAVSRRYRSALEISVGKSVVVVNELPLEHYIRGVVAMEIPKLFHEEAQKALVCAIRTYAYKNLGSKRHASIGFDVCDTTHCQGFAGAVVNCDWIDKIVDQTRGELIVYDDKPINATYSTDCGGMTQNNEDAGFGIEPWPYLRSIADNPGAAGIISSENTESSEDYCAGCRYHTWKKEFTLEELDRAVSKSGLAKIGRLRKIELIEYDSSGRVKTIRLIGVSGEAYTTGSKLRMALGPSVLKSTRMSLSSASNGRYIFKGKGFGHGVGLCAFGANGMAEYHKGIRYTEILKHYYTGVEIKKAY